MSLIGAAQLLLQNGQHQGNGYVLVCTLDVEVLQQELLDHGVGAPEPAGVKLSAPVTSPTPSGPRCPQCGGTLTKEEKGLVDEPVLSTRRDGPRHTRRQRVSSFLACNACEFVEEYAEFKKRAVR